MNISRYFVLIACLLIGVSAVDDLTRTANDYIDLVMKDSGINTGGSIDPLPLDDIKHTFERKIGFMKVKGEASMHDGQLFGLLSLQRKGNAVVLDLDDILIISCELTFKKIYATYEGALIMNGNKGPKIDINAKVGSSVVSMFMMVPSEGGNSTLMSVNIRSLKDIRVSIQGLGPWGWTANPLSTAIMNAIEKPVAKAASKAIFLHLHNQVEKVPFPGVNRIFLSN